MEEAPDYSFRVCILGAHGVGKASLIRRFVDHSFLEGGTALFDNKYRTIKLEGNNVRLQVSNASYELGMRELNQTLYSTQHGFFIVYDVTDMDSYKNTSLWLQEVPQKNQCHMLIGNKTDLVGQRVVATDTAKEYAESLGINFVETSTKDGNNVEQAFMLMAATLIRGQEIPEIEFKAISALPKKRGSFTERLVSKIRLENTMEKFLSQKDHNSTEEGQNDYSGIVAEIEVAKDEEAQSVAEKQEKLEKLLVAAPASVAVLSHICIISSTAKDFKLQIPLKGFKYIKSEWFRGGLMQVVNNGAQSFTMANKNVLSIELLSKSIPSSILEVLQLLLHGSRADIEALLPEVLTSVIEKADQCAKLAAETEEMFESVVALINELAETFTATRSELESQRNKNQAMTNVNFREVVDLLLEGLKNLIQVRVKWNQLSRFFTDLSQIIRLEMQDPLDSFKEAAAKKADKQVKQDKKLSVYAKETLRGKAQEIAQKGFQVNMISEMFLHVSQTYLKDPLLRLDELLTLTENDVALVEQVQIDIKTACKQAEKEIEDKVKKTNEETYAKFRAEMDAIEVAANFGKKSWSVLSIFGRK